MFKKWKTKSTNHLCCHYSTEFTVHCIWKCRLCPNTILHLKSKHLNPIHYFYLIMLKLKKIQYFKDLLVCLLFLLLETIKALLSNCLNEKIFINLEQTLCYNHQRTLFHLLNTALEQDVTLFSFISQNLNNHYVRAILSCILKYIHSFIS